MQRRTVQDPQRTSSSAPQRGVRGTVAKPAVGPDPPSRGPRGPRGRPGRRLAGLGLALVTAAGALVATGSPGGAQAACDPGSGPVVVVEVDGLIDPVLADLVHDQ